MRPIDHLAEAVDPTGVALSHNSSPLLVSTTARRTGLALPRPGLIEGRWEHPDRRTRRYYSITRDGRKEYRRLRGELRPFLDSVIRSVSLIEREIYGEDVEGGG